MGGGGGGGGGGVWIYWIGNENVEGTKKGKV